MSRTFDKICKILCVCVCVCVYVEVGHVELGGEPIS